MVNFNSWSVIMKLLYYSIDLQPQNAAHLSLRHLHEVTRLNVIMIYQQCKVWKYICFYCGHQISKSNS